jgi:hypothetical protein
VEDCIPEVIYFAEINGDWSGSKGRENVFPSTPLLDE